MNQFPVGFLIGIATSSYQIEGARDIEGKGENVWDRLLHTNPEVVDDKSNGDVSCNSYFMYKDDIKIIKDIGFDFYRFSISWARILPSGEGHDLNLEGINHYKTFIDELLANGIQPFITMYHWDLPQKLQDIGGWLNPLIVDHFVDYAKILFENYGDKVKYWTTINEPMEISSGYGDVNLAPMLDLHGVGSYLAGHHLLLAHANAYRLYDQTFRKRQKGMVSIGISGKYSFPSSDSEEDKEAAQRDMQFSIGWIAHPIFSKDGDYPPVMRQRVDMNSKAEGRSKSRLPVFTSQEVAILKGSADFFSYQHYTSHEIANGEEGKNPSRVRDSGVIEKQNKNWRSSNVTWLKVVPEGFRLALNWIKDQYDNPNIFITESGYGSINETSLNDDDRIYYFREYLKELLKSIHEDKCTIMGYTAWSLLDNFEWLMGYTAKFGLVHVDFEDPKRKRQPKKSAEFFKKLLKTRCIDFQD